METDLLQSGLPGNYALQVSKEGEWFYGEKGVQIRMDAGKLKADFFTLENGHVEGSSKIPAQDCRLPLFFEGQDFFFDEILMGWGRFALRAGNYELMNGQNLHPFGNATSIRLKYLGPL